jgi:transcriptional regulator with XRE-family HTH domain
MADLNEVLGKVLADYKRKANLSQETLAFECELHPTYISQIERGLKSPTMRTLFLIGKALRVTPSQIVRDVEKRL